MGSSRGSFLIGVIAIGACVVTSACGAVSSASSGGFVAVDRTVDPGTLFPVYTNRAGGYSFQYPGGWHVGERGSDVRISRAKDAIVAVVRPRHSRPWYRGYQRQLTAQLAKGNTKLISAIVKPARPVKFGDAKVTMAVIAQMRPHSKPKKVITYRYLFWHNGKLLLLSLSSVKGVNNADAYNLIASSFRWR